MMRAVEPPVDARAEARALLESGDERLRAEVARLEALVSRFAPNSSPRVALARDPDDAETLLPSIGKTVSAQRIAREYGVSASTIYAQMDAGKLPYFRWGRARRVALTDLERFLAAARVGK